MQKYLGHKHGSLIKQQQKNLIEKKIQSEMPNPFNYPDTNSSRAGIETLNERFHGQKIAIIGLGGTGSYILDLVTKSPVGEIHLFDGDVFELHNAFRAPGAPGAEDFV